MGNISRFGKFIILRKITKNLGVLGVPPPNLAENKFGGCALPLDPFLYDTYYNLHTQMTLTSQRAYLFSHIVPRESVIGQDYGVLLIY